VSRLTCLLIALKDIETPVERGFARFWGLVVFENCAVLSIDALDSIRLGS
jgi:hypothetical protein